jgi:thiamine-monophosphate kinase
MKIKNIGGEFALISRLTKKVNNPNIIKGVGDDCAVLKYTKNKYLLITTDMMVEGSHFNTKWQTPFQIGMKLMEINVSDIVSMGGEPKYAVISISLKKNTSIKFIDDFYKGLYKSAKKHNVAVIGGDTVSGKEYVFNLALIGEVEKNMLRLRSGAKVGDLICVTGKLGGSTAGLRLLEKGIVGESLASAHRRTPDHKRQLQGLPLRDYLEPKSKTAKIGQIIAKYASAMIDVSDGLGSEVKHICQQSKVGAKIDYNKIPLAKTTIESAKKTNLSAHDFALYGGEDFEIAFTVSKKRINKLKKEFKNFTIIGEVLNKKEGIYILKNDEKEKVKSGYDHFK